MPHSPTYIQIQWATKSSPECLETGIPIKIYDEASIQCEKCQRSAFQKTWGEIRLQNRPIKISRLSVSVREKTLVNCVVADPPTVRSTFTAADPPNRWVWRSAPKKAPIGVISKRNLEFGFGLILASKDYFPSLIFSYWKVRSRPDYKNLAMGRKADNPKMIVPVICAHLNPNQKTADAILERRPRSPPNHPAQEIFN